MVIGAGAAGMAAATRARRVDPLASITVLEAGEEYSRGTCSLPYYVSGEIASRDSLTGISRQSLADSRIELRLSTRATAIEPRERVVRVANGCIPYDRLIVSTGSKAKAVPLVGRANHPRLWTLRSIADADHIRLSLLPQGSPKVAVVGGGYLGLEMAEVLTRRGCRVTLFHRQNTLMRLWPVCHQSLLQELAKHLTVRTGTEVRLIDPDCRQSTVEFQNAQGQRCSEGFDAVVLASGIEPEASLLARAGARLGEHGGVLVDSRGETSLSSVFAAGDGVEMPGPRAGVRRWVPLATTAARLGRVCGENAAGGSLRLPPPLACIAVRLFDLQVAAVGHPQDWQDAEGHLVDFGSESLPFPLRQPARALFLTEPRGGPLLGAQFVGPDAAALANLASLALSQGLRLADLAELDTCYTPPVSGLWHPFYLVTRSTGGPQSIQLTGASR